MKKKQGAFFGFVVLLIAAMFTVAGCDNGNDPGGNSGPDTTIINLPQIALAGTALELGGVVESSVVNNQTTIIWSGDCVVDGTFTATSAGSYEITATVPNGLSEGSDYVKTFTITVYDSTKNQIAKAQGDWTKPYTAGGFSPTSTDTMTITGSAFVMKNDSIGDRIYCSGIIMSLTGTNYIVQVNAVLSSEGQLRPVFHYEGGTYTFTEGATTMTLTSSNELSPAWGTWTKKSS
jgi:hypothetical protein